MTPLRHLTPALLALTALAANAADYKVHLPDDATPADREIAARVVAAIIAAQPRITQALGAQERPSVSLSFKRMPGVAHAENTHITFSLTYLEKHPDEAPGVGVHELTHVIQNYGAHNTPNNGWITEGMADYVRFSLFDGGRYGFTPDPAKDRYDSSYRITGRFMAWCEQRNPGLVKALHTTLSSGGNGPSAWEKHCGAPLPELWSAYSPRPR